MATVKELSDEEGKPRQGCKDHWGDLQSGIRSIWETVRSFAIDIGEAQQVIVKQFGKPIYHIDEDNFDTIKQWFKNNHFRVFQILSPDRHNILMTTENIQFKPYQEWFTYHNKKSAVTEHYTSNF